MFVKRPWGWFVTLISLPFFWLKVLRVKGRTSLQGHYFRTELHLGSKFSLVKPFTEHRLTRGWYIELAWGKPREDDIVRFDDDYGRA